MAAPIIMMPSHSRAWPSSCGPDQRNRPEYLFKAYCGRKRRGDQHLFGNRHPQAVESLITGKSPHCSGASGKLRFDRSEYTNILHSVYYHWQVYGASMTDASGQMWISNSFTDNLLQQLISGGDKLIFYDLYNKVYSKTIGSHVSVYYDFWDYGNLRSSYIKGFVYP